MENLKIYSHEEMLNKIIGENGTTRRDRFNSDLHQYLIGEAIKQARKKKNLTQSQLGELMGVQRAQISKIESGKNLNFTTIARAFKAMNIPAKLIFGNASLSLW